jgi:S-adenosylmethionine hydrolase
MIPSPTLTDSVLAGQVLRVDRFGNLITNIDRKLFDRFVVDAGVEITAASHRIGRLVATYAEAAPDEVCALFGSTDHLEIAVNAGSAADQLSLSRGAPVVIRKLETRN